MKTWTIFLTFFILSVLPCYGLDIVFKESAKVAGETILLGDITDIPVNSELSRVLASQIVSSSPEPGKITTLDSRAIIGRIEAKSGIRHDIKWKGSASVSVQRLCITIDSGKIQAIIDEYIEENRSNLPDAEVRFLPEALPLPFALPQGELTWDVVPSSPSIVGSSRFAIIFKVDGRVRENFSIKGHTEALAPVIVATRKLKFGDRITPDAVSLATRDLSTLKNYTSKTPSVVGSVIKRTIKAGTAINTSLIELPPVIRKGDFVKIVVNHNGLLLTATGIAKGSGRQNEMIRVRNSSSKKLIYCRVQAPGLVEVLL